ncbi:MAG: hypothetical protein ABI690_08970 [Chloroflexota bacterium]
MSRLVERYPHVRQLTHSDSPIDDTALLKLLQPYLGWVLAEIDTGSLDILICDSVDVPSVKPNHLLLLTGRAVVVWLRHANTKLDGFDPNSASPG